MVRNALQYTYAVDEWIVKAHNAHQCFGHVSTTSWKLNLILVILLLNPSSSHLIKYVDIRLFGPIECVLSLDERETILVSSCALDEREKVSNTSIAFQTKRSVPRIFKQGEIT